MSKTFKPTSVADFFALGKEDLRLKIHHFLGDVSDAEYMEIWHHSHPNYAICRKMTDTRKHSLALSIMPRLDLVVLILSMKNPTEHQVRTLFNLIAQDTNHEIDNYLLRKALLATLKWEVVKTCNFRDAIAVILAQALNVHLFEIWDQGRIKEACEKIGLLECVRLMLVDNTGVSVCYPGLHFEHLNGPNGDWDVRDTLSRLIPAFGNLTGVESLYSGISNCTMLKFINSPLTKHLIPGLEVR